MENKKKTPKELFLSRLCSTIQEFEETTGVEVFNIAIDRVNIDNNCSVINKCKLTLK